MTRLLAIDPGNEQSGWVIIDTTTYQPLDFGKDTNGDVRLVVTGTDYDALVIEMIASYGMAVGREVFDTCVWIGRFDEAAFTRGTVAKLTPRAAVKRHHCHTTAAKDANVRQALVDRFASGQPNHGKGTKTSPGWFYGFAADVWQAYALGVAAIDWAREGRR